MISCSPFQRACPVVASALARLAEATPEKPAEAGSAQEGRRRKPTAEAVGYYTTEEAGAEQMAFGHSFLALLLLDGLGKLRQGKVVRRRRSIGFRVHLVALGPPLARLNILSESFARETATTTNPPVGAVTESSQECGASNQPRP